MPSIALSTFIRTNNNKNAIPFPYSSSTIGDGRAPTAAFRTRCGVSVSQRLEFIFIATANQFLSTAVHTRLFQCVFVGSKSRCLAGKDMVLCAAYVLFFYLCVCRCACVLYFRQFKFIIIGESICWCVGACYGCVRLTALSYSSWLR